MKTSPLLACGLSLASFVLGLIPASAQQLPPPNAAVLSAVVAGKWTYRSFVANPDITAGPKVFGEGTMEFAPPEGERLTGTLGGEGWQLNLTGTWKAGEPQTVRFQGRGLIGGEEWVYDYLGYIVPMWPNGVEQRPAIVGTIVRTVAHTGGAAPAGVVAQWIAILQDGPALPAALRLQKPASYREKLREFFEKQPTPGADRPASELPPVKAPTAPAPHALALAIPVLPPPGAPPLPPRVASLQPLTVASNGGRVDVGDLVIDYNNPQGPNPLMIGKDKVRLRTYNGQLVGPVIRAKAGDTIYITLRNNLPAETPIPNPGHSTNGHHEWNTTNLHFHGLHVAPQGTPDAESDNVLLSIPPGGVQKYEVHIPADHVAGTFWYHAHRHGSTAAQVASGLCGALIVERDDANHNLDSIPEVAAAAQEIMVLQAVPYLQASPGAPGTIERSADGNGGNENTMFAPQQWFKLQRYITVNGLRIPEITLAPGEVRRLRLVATEQRESIKLRLEKPGPTPGAPLDRLTLHEIAVDGLPTGGRRDVPEIELFPGYRSDVLIQAPATASGDYYLVDGNAAAGSGADGSPEPLSWIAKVHIAGAPVAMNLPTPAALAPQRLPDLVDPATPNSQYAFYGIVLNPPPVNFFISRQNIPAGQAPTGSEFDPGNVRTLFLGRTERWLVGSRNTQGLAVTHPFHIHVNPFLVTQVLDPTGHDVTKDELGGPVWRDTLAMKHGFTYRLLTRYTQFTGSFVSHCHILDHEDNGMMERISIVDPNASTTPAPAPAGNPGPIFRVPNMVARAVPEPNGKPSVLFFVKDSLCAHCQSQLIDMAAKLPVDRADISVISGSNVQDLQNFPPVPFRLVADPDHLIAKHYGTFNGAPEHATIVRDRTGRELLRKVGPQPFMNVAAVVNALDVAGPRIVVAIGGTDTTDDDYLTWAPTAGTIRVENGNAGGPDLNVVLGNDAPDAIPDGGDVAFAPASLAAGQTAAQPKLELTLKQDGTPVKFFVAGTKASKLTETSLSSKGRDAVIEVRENVAGGRLLTQTAVMVRVRKRIDTLNDLELTQFMKAVNDLHRVQHRYEWYVLMHRLATGHGPNDGDPPADPTWPDQAHAGPAFIAWHRAFLLQFERELQKNFPWVALPYWVQGPGQTFFDAKKLGSNADGNEPVTYDPASPLYGWSIDTLPHDNRVGINGIMGILRRSAHDHNPAISFYQQWGTRLEGKPNFKDAMPNLWSGGPNPNSFNVERNPHNNGHGEIGPPSIWMQNCRESNADPVFWVFHCNHDYIWAHWQYYHNRFATDGADPAHYWPNDAFTDNNADHGVPLGHHLRDTMWPWDGTTGQVVAGQALSNRPTTNTFGQFPASAAPGLWPQAQAKPRPADVIDYLGMGSRESELGFCYDILPWGARVPAQPLLAGGGAPAPAPAANLPAEIFLNNQINPDTRRLAFSQLMKEPSSVDPKRLAETIRNPLTASTLRSDALNLLSQISAEEALGEAVNLLSSPETPANVGSAALDHVGRTLHFSATSHAEMQRAHDAVRGVLASRASGDMRARALRILAPQADPAAKSALQESLAKPANAPVSVSEAISLLRFFPDQLATIRGYLNSSNDGAVVAALQSLHQDAETAELRRKLAGEVVRGITVRRAAIQSLMYGDDDKDGNTLLGIFANPADELSLRAEAIAATRVFLQRRLQQLSEPQKAAWAEKIRAVPADETGAGGLGDLKSQAVGVLANRP